MHSELLKDVFNDIVTFVMTRDMKCSTGELIMCSKLLSFREFNLLEDETCREQLWMNRIVCKFRMATEERYNEKLLIEALEYFCEHFHYLFNLEASEHICLAFVARSLKDIFERDLALFTLWKDRIADYLSDHEESWMKLGYDYESQCPMPPIEISSITNYHFCSRSYSGEDSVVQPYIPFSEKYVKNLQSTRDLKSASWFRFARAMCFISECILRTQPLDQEREESILNMAGAMLEILMLGEAHLTPQARGIQHENIGIVLEIYLKRKGYASLYLSIKQLSISSRLFSCAFLYKFVHNMSKELFFYHLFLDKRFTQVIVKKPLYKFEVEIQKIIEWVVEKGSVYHLVRILSIMIHFSKLKSFTNLPGYTKKYIAPLRSACQLLAKQSNAAGELPLQTVQELINQL
jgi:hypothetical protein